MDTKTLAAGVIGFLLGGLVVSIAAELENGDNDAHSYGAGIHQTVRAVQEGDVLGR